MRSNWLSAVSFLVALAACTAKSTGKPSGPPIRTSPDPAWCAPGLSCFPSRDECDGYHNGLPVTCYSRNEWACFKGADDDTCFETYAQCDKFRTELNAKMERRSQWYGGCWIGRVAAAATGD